MAAGYLIVFVGGGLGAALRHGANHAALAYLGPNFLYATLFVNIVGSLIMGAFVELFMVKVGGSEEFRLFLTTGFLGGFTTFSAFSLDAALMWQRSDYAALASYIVASVLLSIAAVFVGIEISKWQLAPFARANRFDAFDVIRLKWRYVRRSFKS